MSARWLKRVQRGRTVAPMTTLVIVLVVAVLLLVAGGAVRGTFGRNAEEMTDQGNRVGEVPGFDRRDGPL